MQISALCSVAHADGLGLLLCMLALSLSAWLVPLIFQNLPSFHCFGEFFPHSQGRAVLSFGLCVCHAKVSKDAELEAIEIDCKESISNVTAILGEKTFVPLGRVRDRVLVWENQGSQCYCCDFENGENRK